MCENEIIWKNHANNLMKLKTLVKADDVEHQNKTISEMKESLQKVNFKSKIERRRTNIAKNLPR